MATDSTHLLPSDTSGETNSDMAAGPDYSSIQLAAASGDAPIPVKLPHGNQIVVIPVKPGQTIELPTDSPDGLYAKLGADGNLAIVVDGRTIILQGYAAANEEAPIKVVTNDGDAVDITEVVAGTSPDLDIQTAAGPGEGVGPQGNTDATGTGIYDPFAAGPLLGGFDAVGVLGATALQYKLIDNEQKEFVHGPEENHLPQGIVIVPDEGQPVAKDGAFQLDEDFLPPHSPGGNKDLPQPSPGDGAGTDTASGTVVVDFGLDGPRATDPIVMSPIVDPNSGLFALSGGSDPTVPGGEIQLVLDAPVAGQQVLHGMIGQTEYFTVTLDTSTGHFVVEQLEPLFHDDNHSTEGNVFLDIDFTAFDSNGDQLTATLHLDFDDDMPAITQAENPEFALAVDETVSKSGSDFDDPNFEDGPKDGSAVEGDEQVGVAAALVGFGAPIGAANADASVLFDVKIGADDFANNDESQVYSLTILDKNTGLTDTETGDSIVLVEGKGGVILGVADDGDPQTADPVVFALSIDPATGEISMALYRGIDHGDEEAAPGAVDEVLFLGGGHLAATLTVVDGDGDKVSKDVDIGSYISFDDDGPVADKSIEAAIDEDALPTVGNNDSAPGDDSGSASISAAVNFFNFGSDKPGTLSIGDLTVTDSAGETINLADLHTSDGRDITINKSVDAITGDIIWEAVVADGQTGAGEPVFTFKLDTNGTTGFSFDLFQALEHPYTDADSKNTGPETTYEDNLVLDFTIVGTDGDGDQATTHVKIDIDDDSPGKILVNQDALPHLAVDETVGGDGSDFDTTGVVGSLDGTAIENDEELVDLPQSLKNIGTVIGAASAEAGKAFSVDYGADGPAATGAEDFSLKILNADTGLTDTLSGDPIKLVEQNGLILGVADDGDANTVDPVVFALTIDSDGTISMAQYRAIDHGDDSPNSYPDETAVLGSGKLGVVFTATDADGDQVSTTVDIGKGISFDDDGPTADITLKESATLVLDETVGGSPNDNDETKSADTKDIGFASILASALFTDSSVFGSDGGAASDDKVFGLVLKDGDGTNSGLVDTHYGDPILLYDAGGGVVEGKNSNGDVVFTVSVDSTTGNIEVHQYLAVQHNDPNDPDESSSPELFDAGVLLLQVTVTDGDGDKDTDSVDLGSIIKFEDDGPSTDLQLKQDVSIVVDESVGKDAGDPNAADELLSADPNDIGFATILGKDLFTDTTDFGSDKEAAVGSKVFDLIVNGGNGTDSGLDDTQTGDDVLLYDAGGGLIQGKTAGGDLVFTVSVDTTTGDIEVHQYRAIINDDPTDPDEAVPNAGTDYETILADKLLLQLTVTDGDGDTAQDSVDLGTVIKFEDDGPKLTSVFFDDGEDGDSIGGVGIIDEDALPTGIGDKALGDDLGGTFTDGTITFDFGSDKAGGLTIDALTVKDSAGNTINLADLHTSDGHEITINKSLDAGTGVITWEGVVKDGPDAGDPVFTFKVDGSGANIGQFSFELHEALEHPYTDPDFQNNGPETAYEDNLIFDFTVTGTDGDGDSAEAHVKVNVDDDSPTITPTTSGTITLALDETVGGDGKDDDANGVSGTQQDGSAIENDEELVTLPTVLTDIGDPIGAATADASKLFDVDFGADGGAASGDEAFSLKILDKNTGLTDTATGDPIILVDKGNGLIEGVADDGDAKTADPVVFALTIESDGTISMAQYRAIDHGDDDPNSYPDEVLSLGGQKLAVVLTATDADGDQVSAERDIGGSITFDDDGPTADFTLKEGATLVVDETVGTKAGDPNAADEEDSLSDPDDIGYAKILGTALFTDNSVFGSDGPAGSSDEEFALSVKGGDKTPSGLTDTLSGEAVLLYDVGGEIQGRTAIGDVVVFTVTTDANTGDVEVHQYRSVVHDDPNDPDESSSPETINPDVLLLTVTVTDGDGDKDTGSIDLGSIVKFEDDGPTVTPTTNTFSLAVDETVGGDGKDVDANGTNGTQQDGSAIENDESVNAAAVTAAGLSTTGLIGANTASAAGLFTFSAGSDGLASKVFGLEITGGGNTGLTDTATGQAISLFVNGSVIEGRNTNGDVCFALTIDGSTGLVTMADYRAVNHSDDNPNSYPDETATMLSGKLAVTLTVTDKDGDVTKGSHDISGGIVIDDDGPNAVDDTKSAGTSGSITGNVLTDGTDDSFGADGKGSPAITQVVFKGTTFTDNSDGTLDGLIHVQGGFGKLELDTATGAYTYTRTSGIFDTGQDVFSYTIKDGDGDTDTADLKIAIDAANILDGQFITNTNSTDQPLVLTFQELSNPLHFSAKIYSLNAQGQQGTVAQDVGFYIDHSLAYLYSVEAGETTSFTNINVTDFTLENTVLNAAGGSDNWAIRYDDGGPGAPGAGGRELAYNGVFTAVTGTENETDQPSQSGDKNANTLGDPDVGGAGFDVVFGAAGNDTLNGGSDRDLLNGGNGIDQLNGNGGNDILVYDAADVTPAVAAGKVGGGDGADVLRIDDGALAIFFGTKNDVIDLTGADIRNIEVIGLTEEAVSDPTKGTTIKLTAADVLAFADDAVDADGIAANTIYIVGSLGDKVQLASNGAGFVDGGPGAGIQPTATFDDGQGQVFNVFTITGGGALYVDKDITVETVA